MEQRPRYMPGEVEALVDEHLEERARARRMAAYRFLAALAVLAYAVFLVAAIVAWIVEPKED